MELIRTESMSKTYGRGLLLKKRKKVLNGVDIVVKENEIIGIVGESGSGKTTLGKIMAGLEAPTEGAMYFESRNYTGASRCKSFNRKIQMIFQNPQTTLNPRFRVKSFLMEPVRLYEGAGDEYRRKVTRELRKVGLNEEVMYKYPHQLSGGQLQRIALARVFALEPRVIIADEVTSMLDVSVGANIVNLLIDYKERKRAGIVFISHDLELIKVVSDRMYIMLGGKILEEGHTGEVFSEPAHPYTRELIDNMRISLSLKKGQSFTDLYDSSFYLKDISIVHGEELKGNSIHKYRTVHIYRGEKEIL